MQNAKNKEVDETFLSIPFALFQGMIHRDYMIHCFRWTHVIKHLMRSDVRKAGIKVLEIGCGKETPFLSELITDEDKYKNIDYPGFRAIRSHKLIADTSWYVGVDVTKIKLSKHLSGKANRGKIVIADETNFAEFTPDMLSDLLINAKGVDDTEAVAKPNVIICNEVAEHMPYEDWLQVLDRIKEHCDEDTVVFVSTPSFSGQAAKNHVNEYTFDAFGAVLEDHGFGFPLRDDPQPEPLYEVQAATVFGTFGQQRHIFPVAEQYYGKEAWDKVKQTHLFFDPNVISILHAPNFPRESSNVLWEFTVAPDKYKRYFPKLDDVEKPWGSGWVDDPFSKRGRSEGPDKVVENPSKADDQAATTKVPTIAEVTAATTVAELLSKMIAAGYATAQAWIAVGDTPIDYPATTIAELIGKSDLTSQHPAVVPIRFTSRSLTPGESMTANLQTWCMDLVQGGPLYASEEPEQAKEPKAKKNVDKTVENLIALAGDKATTIFIQVKNTESDTDYVGLLAGCQFGDAKLHNCTGSFVPPGKPLVQESNLLELYKELEA